MKSDKKKIIILPNFGLGDLIQLSTIFKKIKEYEPNISVFCAYYSEMHKKVIEKNPYLDGLVKYNDPYNVKNYIVDKVKAFYANFNVLRNFEEAYLFVPVESMGQITERALLLSKIKYYIMPTEEGNSNQCLAYQDFVAKCFNGLSPYEMPQYYMSEKEQELAKYYVDKHGLTGATLVALAYDAGKLNKHIPIGMATMICDYFCQLGCKVLVIKGNNYPQKASQIIDLSKYCLHIIEEKDLRILLAIISVCQIVVSADTGIGHFSAAMGIPTISLFGPTSLRFVPVGKKVCIIHKSSKCSAKKDKAWCEACEHKDFINDGKHASACMYWYNEKDFKQAINFLAISHLFGK